MSVFQRFLRSNSLLIPALLGMFFCSAVPGNAFAQEEGDAGPLLSTSQLAEHLDSEKFVILDLGPERESYDQGHIPGARYVDWVEDITDESMPERYMILDQAALESLMSRLGVHEGHTVVLYDDLNTRTSIRMYWTLKFYGVDDVRILDGGRQKWIAESRPLSVDAPTVQPTEFRVQQVRQELSVDLEFIADRLQNPNVTLIDGRPVDQYTGKAPGKVFHTGALHEQRGHIPGAINIFWKDNFNEDGTFKSIAELRELYDAATGSEMVVTYCNEGLHATPAWFVLAELLGQENVRVYDASMSEWANSDQPVDQDK